MDFEIRGKYLCYAMRRPILEKISVQLRAFRRFLKFPISFFIPQKGDTRLEHDKGTKSLSEQ